MPHFQLQNTEIAKMCRMIGGKGVSAGVRCPIPPKACGMSQVAPTERPIAGNVAILAFEKVVTAQGDESAASGLCCVRADEYLPLFPVNILCREALHLRWA